MIVRVAMIAVVVMAAVLVVVTILMVAIVMSTVRRRAAVAVAVGLAKAGLVGTGRTQRTQSDGAVNQHE